MGLLMPTRPPSSSSSKPRLSGRKNYGNTDWGRAWVEALERIDSNRLARGRTYANTKRVLSLSVNNGKVSARVMGSYGEAYEIRIQLQPFTAAEKTALYGLISRQASLAIDLATGQLPPALLDAMQQAKLQLLPKRWRDLTSRCSCPDSANPCKHLAAVYYLLANELDKDPFLLFQLKGVPAADLIQAAGLQGTSAQKRENALLARFVSRKETARPNPEEQAVLEGLTFVFPKRNLAPLWTLLPDRPSFFPEGNFKSFLAQLYQEVSAALAQADEAENDTTPVLARYPFQLEVRRDEYSPQHAFILKMGVPEPQSLASARRDILQALAPQASSRPNIHLIEDHLWSFGLPETRSKPAVCSAWVIEPLGRALDMFLRMPLSLGPESASESFWFLTRLAHAAFGMAIQGQFDPEVLYETPEAFQIRYLPARNTPEVQAALQVLAAAMPPDLCHFGMAFLPQEAVAELLGLLITHWVHQALKPWQDPAEHRLLRAFTEGRLFRPQGFTEKTMGPSLENWLERLHLAKGALALQLRLEERADAFRLAVDVLERQNPLALVPYADLFALPGKQKKLPKTVFGRPTAEVQTEAARQLTLLSRYLPELRGLVDSQGREAPILTLDRLAGVLTETAALLNVLGVGLILPKALRDLARPTLQVRGRLRTSQETGASLLNLHELLEFSYEVALGDEEVLSPQAFRRLVKQARGLVKVKDRYVLLDAEAAQRLLDKLNGPPPEATASPFDALYAATTEQLQGVALVRDAHLEALLARLTRETEDVVVPDTLHATLRPYQVRGFQWLAAHARNGLGACIADDMGLGKTLQVIALLLHHHHGSQTHETTPSLVVCPTTLLGNWAKECERFAPSLRVHLYHGSERQLPRQNVDVILTSYGVFRRDLKRFQTVDWRFFVIDEAQNIKNSDTAQTRAIKALKARHRIAMTGTPVENRLTELWNLFDFINPGYLSPLKQFKTEIAAPIEKYRDLQALDLLRKATAPFLLRRLKTDKALLPDLPDKLLFDEYCNLTAEQAAVYQNIVDAALQEIESSEGIRRKGLIFRLMTALKQLCNHPAHFANQPQARPELSGKSAKTLALLQAIFDSREKALIFTQYREMGTLLERMIASELGETPLFFHGGLSRPQRDAMVEAFQQEARHRLMIVSLKAGGTGLNLTAASHVLHYDLWWNPAVENQATDRVYRIGQTRKVVVHRLITLGTFEEKIDDMLKAKQELANLTISSGENWLTELSDGELQNLFRLTPVR
jgi:uncharacterized Zn finger protein/superfamily II DNA or RNA helicase